MTWRDDNWVRQYMWELKRLGEEPIAYYVPAWSPSLVYRIRAFMKRNVTHETHVTRGWC